MLALRTHCLMSCVTISLIFRKTWNAKFGKNINNNVNNGRTDDVGAANECKNVYSCSNDDYDAVREFVLCTGWAKKWHSLY